ncbi:Rv3235 family protein [Arthrobacter sp. GMC3]|uniref:Rv3235 family protein n=1 Tax=Arthrobacter sp. GMC3 TaxID=2058894 RepID=UPI000CE398F6|nr:Rv3235 family protein [Arthrobacter sp. GMC3]
MNTLAITEASTPVTRLISRPAPVRSGSPGNGVDTAATVVKFPQRAVGKRSPEDVRFASADSSLALDTQSTEKALLAEMSRRISQAALEVLSGSRSVQQLARWLDVRCLNALTTRARLHAEACQAESRHPSQSEPGGKVQILRHQPIVHSTHVCAVAPGIFETSVVIADKTRFRAIAMRFEETGGLWKVTALQIG